MAENKILDFPQFAYVLGLPVTIIKLKYFGNVIFYETVTMHFDKNIFICFLKI